MERGGAVRFLILGIGGLFLFLALQKWFGGGGTSPQPLGTEAQTVAPNRAPDNHCNLWTPEFHASLRTHGGTLTKFDLLKAKYRKNGKPLDVSTTPDPSGDHEFRQQLFAKWRADTKPPKEAAWNMPYDSVDFDLAESNASHCKLVYEGPSARIERLVTTTGRPYELEVKDTLTNLAPEARAHAYRVDTVAWRLNSEVEGKMFRISPYVTHVECLGESNDAVRLLPTDFEPDDFGSEHFARGPENPNGAWYVTAEKPAAAAVSNAYFTHALVPISAPRAPRCLLQVEERFDATRGKGSDPSAGAMYRARLAYPIQVLQPKASATYEVLTYVGPKERTVLAAAGGGKHHLDELIDLGFFSSIAKILVRFLLMVHGVIPNWGLAIILLTVTARLLLFPLSWPSIKNMVRMRELKPEMDALTAKYKDDPQARGLAQMELWRKHNVNPLKGCLPQLASMPVWFALYTTLQTAVELYNIPFLWFPDLSESDPLFILPFVIGGTYFLQQRIMPMQGGDPMQQKMMMYFMPGMFTVLMLFLPSGLGVYMFTNSLLAIGQQVLVERHTKRTLGAGGGDIQVREKGDPEGDGKKKNKRKSFEAA